MDNYKTWPRIAIIATSVVAIIGMFLPWVVASGWGQVETKNVIDAYFDPTKWVLFMGIITTMVFSVLALVIKKDGLYKTSGILGIILSVIVLGAIGLVCLGTSSINARVSSYGAQEEFGAGLYVSAIAIIANFVLSIISLKAKK